MSTNETRPTTRACGCVERMAFDSAVVRFESVRADMRQRTWIQNTAMAVVWISAVAASLACDFFPERAFAFSMAFDGLALAATVTWMHSDISVMKFSGYLVQELEPIIAPTSAGYEKFYLGLRPNTALRSLWVVSTRAILIGSQLVVALVASVQLHPSPSSRGVIIVGLLGAVSAWYLTRTPTLIRKDGA